MQKKDEGRDELFAEWTRQVFDNVRSQHETTTALRTACEKCRRDCFERITIIERKIGILGVKVGAVIAITGAALVYIVQRFFLLITTK